MVNTTCAGPAANANGTMTNAKVAVRAIAIDDFCIILIIPLHHIELQDGFGKGLRILLSLRDSLL